MAASGEWLCWARPGWLGSAWCARWWGTHVRGEHNNGVERSGGQGREGRVQGFATRAVHSGMNPKLDGTRPTTVPIYATSTFLSDDADALDGVLAGTKLGYVYGRYGNPTLASLEEAASALQGAHAHSST